MKNRFLLITTLSFILSSVFSLMPVSAQPTANAGITLDGRQLFKVSRLEGFDAQPRADYANQSLSLNSHNWNAIISKSISVTTQSWANW